MEALKPIIKAKVSNPLEKHHNKNKSFHLQALKFKELLAKIQVSLAKLERNRR